jgi:hypothetical protein
MCRECSTITVKTCMNCSPKIQEEATVCQTMRRVPELDCENEHNGFSFVTAYIPVASPDEYCDGYSECISCKEFLEYRGNSLLLKVKSFPPSCLSNIHCYVVRNKPKILRNFSLHFGAKGMQSTERLDKTNIPN